MATIAIRPYQPNDHAFVMSTMRTTLTTKSAFMQGLHPAVVDTLLEPIVTLFTTSVATTTGDSNTILGYLLYSLPNTVGFVFVREQLRDKHIATKLLEHAGIAKGEIISPFMVTNQFGGMNFPKFVGSKGYTVRHRPYITLNLQAEMLIPKLDDTPTQTTTHSTGTSEAISG